MSGQSEVLTASFMIQNEIRVEIPVIGTMTCKEVKKTLIDAAHQTLKQLVSEHLLKKRKSKALIKNLDDYVLSLAGLYNLNPNSNKDALNSESLPIHRCSLIQVCNKCAVEPKLELVHKNSPSLLDDKLDLGIEIKQQSEISSLIGQNYINTYLIPNEEDITACRRDFTKVRLETLQGNAAEGAGNDNVLHLPEYKHSEPLPLKIPQNIFSTCTLPIPVDSDPDVRINCRVVCTDTSTIKELKSKIFKKFQIQYPQLAQGKSEEDYLLKVTGYSDYLASNDLKVLDYDYIRKCLSKEQTIELSLVEIATIELNDSSATSYSNFLDKIVLGSGGNTSQEGVPLSSVDKPYRVFIQGISNLKLPEESGEPLGENGEEHPLMDQDCEDGNSSGGSGITASSASLSLSNGPAPSSPALTQSVLPLPGAGLSTVPSVATLGMNTDLKDSVGNGPLLTGVAAPTGVNQLFVQVELHHGGHDRPLCAATTTLVNEGPNPKWNQWLTFPTTIKSLSTGTRVCFTVYRRRAEDQKDTAIAWIRRPVFQASGRLRDSMETLNLWIGENMNPFGGCSEFRPIVNAASPSPPPPLFSIMFENHGKPLLYTPPIITPSELEAAKIRIEKEKNCADSKELDQIIQKDSLSVLTPKERKLLWENRYYCCRNNNALTKCLLSISWDDREQVDEAIKMLKLWALPTPVQALELLDSKFSHPTIRDFAVERLMSLEDGDCADYLLQLTQVLKYEIHHDSSLARFLLKRAWLNRKIGHAFFWHLKAELHLPEIAERYCVLLEAYLRGSGDHRKELMKQVELIDKLYYAADKIKKVGNPIERKGVLLAELETIKIPSKCQLPLDRRMEGKSLIVNKCKYMDSKKLPLWLVFENAEPNGKPFIVIFKAGDDLRQDVLTLQTLRLMDKLWKQEGLDLRLQTYGCIATGNEIGMIEVVLNSETTANINKQSGGASAVLNMNTLRNWLKKNNKTDDEYQRAQDNFCLSCAGYCVATYVLGIGDRHNDNIMLTKTGHLFHIDFGHFLGNFKKKFGFKREKAPFVFVPQYAAILGGTKDPCFQKFVDVCCTAYNILRKHAPTFINLFQMMLCTGIPELQNVEDIYYMRDAFLLGMSDQEASLDFQSRIYQSLDTKTTRLNDVIHVWVHS